MTYIKSFPSGPVIFDYVAAFKRVYEELNAIHNYCRCEDNIGTMRTTCRFGLFGGYLPSDAGFS